MKKKPSLLNSPTPQQNPNEFWPALYLLWGSIQTMFFIICRWLGKMVTIPAPIGLVIVAIFLMWRGLGPIQSSTPAVVQYINSPAGSLPANPETPPPSDEILSDNSNDVAPVEWASINKVSAQDYIARFNKLAITYMHTYGVPASISLAQGLCESRAGSSKLAIKAKNHFGIKCFSRKCKAGHCIRAADDSHKDFFVKYNSVWESWRAHSKMVSSGRYAKLKKYGKDYRKWAIGLKACGYATDPAYASKLISIIEANNLYKYDKL